MDTRKIFGLKRLSTDVTDYTSLVGANCTNQWFWAVGCYDLDGGTVTSTVFNVIITITYYLEFFDRVDKLAQS